MDPELLSKLGGSYIKILKAGLLAIREAAELGDLELCAKEAVHLHNLPSLIGEENIERHIYYYAHEMVDYLEWVMASGREDLKLFVKTFYCEPWDEIGSIIRQVKPLSPGTEECPK